ncbi:MAG TPA: thioredoxin domain-containing protein [Terriglobales bacterium]|nr:thioredoxin domain-containing protein [Terriglobales bacterium]
MRSWLLLAALLASVTLSGQTPAAKAGKAQAATASAKALGPAEVEQVLKRMYGYDPSVKWQIFLVRKAAVPGMTEVLLNVNTEFQRLFITPDGRYAISGDLMPFGADLYGPSRKKLLAADGVSRGPEKPSVVMVEFSDLQCPHCKEAQPVVERLAADFPQMKVVFQQYPLPSHAWAPKAARYADCAGRMNNSAAWKFIAAVYENQGGIAVATADDKLKEIARSSGFDAEQLAACAAAPAAEARVKKSIALGDSLGILGTPAVFVNGRMLDRVSGVPYEQVKKIVQYEVEHAGK